MVYRKADCLAKLIDLFPPSTTYGCALIYDPSSTLDETSTTSQWLALEVNTANRPSFTTPSESSYQISSGFLGAYFNTSISIVNASGSTLEWTHYAVLDGAGALQTYYRVFSGNTVPASTTESRDVGIKLEYNTISYGA
jgi:hypothetical protein